MMSATENAVQMIEQGLEDLEHLPTNKAKRAEKIGKLYGILSKVSGALCSAAGPSGTVLCPYGCCRVSKPTPCVENYLHTALMGHPVTKDPVVLKGIFTKALSRMNRVLSRHGYTLEG